MVESDVRDPSVEDEEVSVVLAAIDTSALTSRVIELAARIARRTWPNAQLHLVHVYPSAPFDRPGAAGLRSDDLVAEARNHLEFHVRMARRQCPSTVTGHLLVGDPVDEIVRHARSLSADLLLIGTHDKVGLQRLLLGSVAEKVAKRAPCSVFMVRQKQRPYKKVTPVE
jgi:nucleotide-binding universal stress UspA family protein